MTTHRTCVLCGEAFVRAPRSELDHGALHATLCFECLDALRSGDDAAVRARNQRAPWWIPQPEDGA